MYLHFCQKQSKIEKREWNKKIKMNSEIIIKTVLLPFAFLFDDLTAFVYFPVELV